MTDATRATPSSPWTLPLRALAFGLWFAWAVLRSAGAVVADVLTPRMYARPRVVRLPLESRRDAHVAAIGALITLTPGTLTLGVVPDGDGRALLVHSMYDDDEETAVAALRDMEARMLRGLSVRGLGGGAP